MEKKEADSRQNSNFVSLPRRDFCKAVLKSSLAALALSGAAGSLIYKKPAMKSFFGVKEAYAQTTGGVGFFTLFGSYVAAAQEANSMGQLVPLNIPKAITTGGYVPVSVTSPTNFYLSVKSVGLDNGMTVNNIFNGMTEHDVMNPGEFPGITRVSIPTGTYYGAQIDIYNDNSETGQATYAGVTYYTTQNPALGGQGCVASTSPPAGWFAYVDPSKGSPGAIYTLNFTFATPLVINSGTHARMVFVLPLAGTLALVMVGSDFFFLQTWPTPLLLPVPG